MNHKKPRVKVEVIRESGYGKVPGLDDDELADYSELLRQVMTEQWAPVLDIPLNKSGRFIKPAMDEKGNVDWGAFGTFEFDKMFPFDKRFYKIDMLCEELRNTLIMFDILKERVPEKERLEVIKYVYSGKDVDYIDDWHQWRMAHWFSRARTLRAKIKWYRNKLRD